MDNILFGDDANDRAIGVELCRTGKFAKAYDRYTGYMAYLCRKFGLKPNKHIVSHKVLDPQRRYDPQSWLQPHGISWERFISDVKRVYDAWAGSSEEIEAPKTGVKSAVTSNPEKVLRKGSKGAAVKELQKKLIAAGFKLPRFGADGHYGDETVAAVKAFQKVVGISVDGIYGPATDNKLDHYKKPSKKNESKSAVVTYPGKLIRIGARGKNVERIQRAVGVKADGIFGANTEKTVKAYQQRHGLSADGIVGPATWEKMF